MAKSVTLRQGTAAEHAGFTGEMAEVTFDTTNNTVILHDGSTPGGIPMAKLSDVPVDLTDLTDVDDNINTAINIGAFSGTTYVVTVASGTNAYSTGNKYYITDLTDASPTVTLTEGVTYRFDQSDSTNTGHPLKFSTTADGTHDSGIEYTTGVTYNGVPGQAGAYTEITVEVGAPTLYYYCTNHSGMGDAPVPPPTPMWSLSGDSNSFVAVSDSKLDTGAASYVALNHPSGRGNAWALEDGSYALRNNSNLVNDPGTRPLHIWSTDDLSDGMTTQYWIKFDANQPAMWEALHGVEAGSSQAHSYSISLSSKVNSLAWAGNGAYGYFGHTSNGSSSFPDQGWLHIAEEIQSNGRQVIYINGVVVVNESASDLSGLTNKANLYIGSVSSWITDIEVYTGGGIHNPDLLATPPGFTPPTRKVAASTGWTIDLSNVTYDSVSFGVNQDNDPASIAFNNDGTKMYMMGSFNKNIYQYTLSTGFDLSTASYDNVSFYVGSQDNSPMRLKFNTDGTKMYINGLQRNKVHQYSLGSGFDLSTASYDNVAFEIPEWNYGFTFNNDGTKMYSSSNALRQYSLSAGFDISTATYDNVNFDLSSQSHSAFDTYFNSDGTKMYILFAGGEDDVHQYTLTTGFDISTASYDNVMFSVGSEETNPTAICISSDGTKMYSVGASNDTVYQYSTGL